MLTTCYPGTTVAMPETLEECLRACVLSPVFAVTKGLSLAQVRELTGLESTTIQNWVKRGWVQNPRGKRYSEIQVARILIINILRDSLRLERIAQLMGYLNGSVDDRSDDIIPENELYDLLSSMIIRLDYAGDYSHAAIRRLIEDDTQDFSSPLPDSLPHLRKALEVMLLAYASSSLKRHAERHLSEIIGEK